MRPRGIVWAALLAGLASHGAAAAHATSHVVVGELVRVSLPRGAVGVKLVGPPPREIEIRVRSATVISSRGRPLRLADLRPGERITVACTDDDAGVHNAQRIKLGGKR